MYGGGTRTKRRGDGQLSGHGSLDCSLHEWRNGAVRRCECVVFVEWADDAKACSGGADDVVRTLQTYNHQRCGNSGSCQQFTVQQHTQSGLVSHMCHVQRRCQIVRHQINTTLQLYLYIYTGTLCAVGLQESRFVIRRAADLLFSGNKVDEWGEGRCALINLFTNLCRPTFKAGCSRVPRSSLNFRSNTHK